jgi:exopolyphosphatase / guanosine-5'-triphosphate,3'-diphosphate pyrophosphatase
LIQFQQLESLAERSDVYKYSERVAIIDMGSNSFRLIVMEYVPRLSFKMTDEVRESVRIGEGMSEVDLLRPAAMDRAARAAQIYGAFCRSLGLDDVIAVGTSAIRDARNRSRYIDRVKRETDIDVRVLSGEEEAYYGYLAAVNSTTLENGYVVDLGGGSMQITRVEQRASTHSVSFPLGAVRCTEGFLLSDPATPGEIKRLSEHLREQLATLDWLKREPGMTIVGEGGTLRLIGRLAQKRISYPLDDLHGYVMTLDQVASIRDELARLSIAARGRIPGMKPDRADISLAGAVVVSEVMRAAGFDEMAICNQGLREGLFYERFLGSPPIFENVRSAAVLNLAHVYRFQEKHAEHITHLTLSMFDQLPLEVNQCGANEREILWAASMLHDIGVSIDYHDHHKHGSYLILNAGLPGYTHREIALIALLVRYHRKGKPTPDELANLLESGDEVRLLQLSALLRLAEQLDRSRDGVVRDVTLIVTGEVVTMELIVRGDEQVALWAVMNNREIFEQAFGLTLDVVSIPESEV